MRFVFRLFFLLLTLLLLPQLDPQLTHHPLLNRLLQLVRLLIRQGTVHRAVVEAVALRFPSRLRVRERVDLREGEVSTRKREGETKKGKTYKLNSLHQISRNIPHNLHQIILMPLSLRRSRCLQRQPKRRILVALGVLRVRLERRDLALLELVQESRVFGPEEADVGDGEEDHGDALETESEGPTLFVTDVCGRDSGVREGKKGEKGKTNLIVPTLLAVRHRNRGSPTTSH
jgi:hypothetical protein